MAGPRARERAPLTAEQERELRAVFDLYDADGDGVVSLGELWSGLSTTGGLSEAEVRELFEEADLDRNGVVDFGEFKEALMDHYFADADAAIASTYRGSTFIRGGTAALGGAAGEGAPREASAGASAAAHKVRRPLGRAVR